ncbi:superfamily I DNA and/or RNA helicase [Bradyrhizobium sp. AZCC 1577]
MGRLLALAQEWTEALSSSSRNFEEFLAKTKTIVTGTCVGLGQTRVRIDQADFDWVIVDEAARCTPGELAVPLQLGRRVLLVGDHFQLKPMVDDVVTRELCREFSQAQITDIQRSEFERAFVSSYGIKGGQVLNEQYRMAPPICDLVSDVFYKPRGVVLVTSEERNGDVFFTSAAAKKLLPSCVTWIDTSSEKSHVERPDERNPWDIANLAEANAIVSLLKSIQQNHEFSDHLADLADDHPIGIICMYKEQRVLLERLLAQSDLPSTFRDLVRLDTVDSYQGKENAIVIVSLVRCNAKGTVGHVGNMNRCNVPCRARKSVSSSSAPRECGAGLERRVRCVACWSTSTAWKGPQERSSRQGRYDETFRRQRGPDSRRCSRLQNTLPKIFVRPQRIP